jgi:serine/threonine protein kinase
MCGVPIRYKGVKHSAPEIPLHPTGQVNGTAADVYMVGDILYEILTGIRPWKQKEDRTNNPLYPHNITKSVMRATKLKGVIPHLPEKYYKDVRLIEDLAVQTLWQATRACYMFEPERRPTAFQLAVNLTRAYQRIQSKRTLVKDDISQFFPVQNDQWGY